MRRLLPYNIDMQRLNWLVFHLKHSSLLLLRPELRAVVEIRELLIANMHDQVNLAVAVHILKLSGDGDLRRVVANNGGSVVDAGMGNTAAGQLNDDDAAFQVEENKMGGMICTVSMADYRINLVRPGVAVRGVELMLAPP